MERLTRRKENGSVYCRLVKGASLIGRMVAIEDILGDDYDLDHLRELVQSDRDGRCFIVLMYGEEEGPSENDPVGPKGEPGIPVKIICKDEAGNVTTEKWKWLMNRFIRGEIGGT